MSSDRLLVSAMAILEQASAMHNIQSSWFGIGVGAMVVEKAGHRLGKIYSDTGVW